MTRGTWQNKGTGHGIGVSWYPYALGNKCAPDPSDPAIFQCCRHLRGEIKDAAAIKNDPSIDAGIEPFVAVRPGGHEKQAGGHLCRPCAHPLSAKPFWQQFECPWLEVSPRFALAKSDHLTLALIRKSLPQNNVLVPVFCCWRLPRVVQ